jgi:hypothetical protein
LTLPPASRIFDVRVSLGESIMATTASIGVRDQSFWQKMALGIALFIVFGFLQFSARGFVNVAAVPIHVHLHGIVMLSWLALTVVQPWLVSRDNLALHRRLGWLGVVLAAGVVVLGSYTGIQAVITQRQPPFFTLPYFLALTQVGVIAFAGMIAAAVIRRRRTDWHRRLMLGALILIMEPALGRILPMPLIMPWGEWLTLAFQLGTLAIVARHDRKTLGAVHPATFAAGLAITLTHVVVELLAITPAWAALTARVAAA